MMTRTLLACCAPMAMAAVAALPAAAQDAVTVEPVIVLPAPAPAPSMAPVPTIVLPETTVEPAAPVVGTTAEAAPAATGTTPRTPVRASTAPRAAAPAPSAETAVAAPVGAAPVVANVAEPVEPAPIVRGSAPVAANNDATGEIAIAGLLGALGLAAVGGVAYAASRRRRRVALQAERYEPGAEEAIVEPALVPGQIAARTSEPVPEPVFTSPAPAASAFATPVVAAASAKPTAPRASGDPIPLPAEMPETFEERDALLKELVAAEPDRANPFTGVRARARRAKLIMQSLGQDFRDRKPRIDLSEYTNRWPALRGWQPATA